MNKKKPSAPKLVALAQNDRNYPKKPDVAILEAFPNRNPGRDYQITFTCPEFTSICPVTGQPDFGTITISYVPGDACIESKSLKLYLGAYRTQGAFAEQIVNQILDDCVACCAPALMVVNGKFSARGGITIEVEAEHDRDFDDSNDLPF
jgi:7-cyano-7-deazaguanine reductase